MFFDPTNKSGITVGLAWTRNGCRERLKSNLAGVKIPQGEIKTVSMITWEVLIKYQATGYNVYSNFLIPH